MRTELVSTSKLRVYRILMLSLVILASIAALAFPIVPFSESQRFSNYIVLLPLVWYFSFRAIREAKKYKTISYDDSSIYYEKDGYEVQIPFEDIKNIELYQGWAINLYRPTQDGDRIMFLPSLWYPLNFRKKDAEIDKLRDKIDQYKRSMPERNFEGLSSHHI